VESQKEHSPLDRTLIGNRTDVELAEQLRDRDPEAHTFVFRDCSRLVQSSSFRVLHSHDHVDDVVQRVFEELWCHPERFDPARGSIGQYLAMQGRNRSIDLLRSEVSRIRRECPHEGAPQSGLEKSVVFENESEMTEWLDRLPVTERDVIELAYFGQMTYREVAQYLELPDGTVKSRIRNGLLRLRTLIPNENGHPTITFS
jgi:RNA polymerase sigma-70 factor, ECF subfamily